MGNAEIRISAENLAAWQTASAGMPTGEWGADETDDAWRLFLYTSPTAHGNQILKAPKHGTPYAEYWPMPAEAAYILAACNAFPALLAEVQFLRAGLGEIAASLPAHADGACCFQDQGYACRCDIAAAQRLIVDLLHSEEMP